MYSDTADRSSNLPVPASFVRLANCFWILQFLGEILLDNFKRNAKFFQVVHNYNRSITIVLNLSFCSRKNKFISVSLVTATLIVKGVSECCLKWKPFKNKNKWDISFEKHVMNIGWCDEGVIACQKVSLVPTSYLPRLECFFKSHHSRLYHEMYCFLRIRFQKRQ